MPITELGFWGQQFMVWVLILIPALGIVGYVQIRRKKPLPLKRERYRRALIGQAGFLVITVVAAREQRVQILAGPLPSLTAWLVAAGFLVIMGLRLRQAWARLSPERLERARILLPDHPSQMRWWVAISAMAGITEECAYRGLAMRFLTDNNSSFWLALLLCVSAFAIAHAIQGWRGILATATIALLLHGVVYETGSLYLAIVVHAVYDLMVGIIAVPILCELAKKQELLQTAGA